MSKTMHHRLYMQGLKTRTTDSLKYALNDASEALAAMPDGINAGFYADECHYINMELRMRSGKAMYTGN